MPFNNLWSSKWPAEQKEPRPNNENAVRANNEQMRQPHPIPQAAGHLFEDDASMLEIEDEDELAERMFIQFPAYGSHNQAQTFNQLNPTADWLLGGTGNIPNPQQQRANLLKQKEQKEAEEAENVLPTGAPDAANGAEPKNATPDDDSSLSGKRKTYNDWHANEQGLWKKSPKKQENKTMAKDFSDEKEDDAKVWTPKSGTVSASSRLNVDKSKLASATSDMKLHQGSLQSLRNEKHRAFMENWTEAYFYHTGVRPKSLSPEAPPCKQQYVGETTVFQKQRNAMITRQSQSMDDYDHVQEAEYDPVHALSKDSEAKSLTPVQVDGKVSFQDDRQHWMPDQLCKQCYACDTSFTVFRRRHHCRLCGQVFCNSCSGYFVPSQDSKREPTSLSMTSKTTKTILRICKMCFEQVSVQQQFLEDSANDTGRKKKKKEDSISTERHATNHGQSASDLSVPEHRNDDQFEIRDPNVSAALTKRRNETAFGRRLLHSKDSFSEEKMPDDDYKRQQKHEYHGMRISLKNQTPTIKDAQDGASKANQRLGQIAAEHLERMGELLLKSEAPMLAKDIAEQVRQSGMGKSGEKLLWKKWVNTVMSLATRCCSTVDPNVKKGDLLDIRPYCKVKVIPGGLPSDCAYISGLLFRKTIGHKKMAREIYNPKIMLLNGGIEFTRTENRMASLDTLLEQEETYMEILVGRILKLKPDILVVGRSVSRCAQALLLKARVVLLQHVKSSILSRLSRLTGATIISSTDHVMNQFGAHVLGKCNRFRFVVARNNDVWCDGKSRTRAEQSKNRQKSDERRSNIDHLILDLSIENHQRQAALAARMLGEDIMEGTEAVKCGLADRRVCQSYILIEGCPQHLGCTIVLRGASRSALKQVKNVFRFLINVAYNLKLETCYLKERCARLKPDFQLESRYLYSSSLCVDYGQPSGGRQIRPWNGGSNNDGSQKSITGKVTSYDHQSILITSVWMTDKTQCCPAEVKGICYYSLQDVSLGQFLRDSCFNLSLKCQNPTCKKSVLDHSLSFVHNDGLINITVDHLDEELPPAPIGTYKKSKPSTTDDDESDEPGYNPIATWTYCKNCSKVVTPLVFISESTWKYSFGKFLESFFYNRSATLNSPGYGCSCDLQTSATLFFGCGRLAARFSFEEVRPFGVFVRKSLPIDHKFHQTEALRQLEQISIASSRLFVKFDKHIDRVSREARSLYSASTQRSDHFQTLLSELGRISSEVDHAAKTLQEKIASVSAKCSQDDGPMVSEALFRFPWFSRRYLFMLCAAWNEKLSAAGQAIVAMKKLAASSSQRSDSVMAPNVPAIAIVNDHNEELYEGIRRLRQLHEVYSRYNLTDITTVMPSIHGNGARGDDGYDDDFEDPDGAIDFADGVDADVLASRRRLTKSSTVPSLEASSRPRKSLGTRRSEDSPQPGRLSRDRSVPDTISTHSVSSVSKVTPGGAVKSAITRFFNRGGRESDPYVVDLGVFTEGRPRLQPGVNGVVIPVIDEQLCTIIAYSLSSTEYANQFQHFSKSDLSASESFSESGSSIAESASGHNSNQSRGRGAQKNSSSKNSPSQPNNQNRAFESAFNEKQDIERRMLMRNKSHIKHTFRDVDDKGQSTCKFVCTTYWATQFHAVRQVFLSLGNVKDKGSFSFQPGLDVEQAYVQSLSSAYSWAASGGKSGASFARSSDDRFVIKCISRTELQMFLDCAPAYFEYLSKTFFHGLPTVLCKIVGVYQIGYHNRITGKRSMEQVAVMQNIFYKRKISRTFDLKGSLRGRFASQSLSTKEDSYSDAQSRSTDHARQHSNGQEDGSDARKKHGSSSDPQSNTDESGQTSKNEASSGTLLDGDFLDFTTGRPMPMNDRAKAVFHMSILNDTLFLSIINVLDYSILVGIDEENMELVVGIIDFMRQYDILKQMERVGKSLPMVVGSEAPTIIQPPLYKARFTNAMERYFMTVPNKWTII